MIPPVDIFTDASVKHKRGAWGAGVASRVTELKTCYTREVDDYDY